MVPCAAWQVMYRPEVVIPRIASQWRVSHRKKEGRETGLPHALKIRAGSITPVVTAAISTTSTSAAPAAETASRALLTRPGHVHGQRTALDLEPVQGFDGRLRRFIRRHRDEGETAGAARGAIQHQIGFDHCAVLGEQVLEFVFGNLEMEVPDEEFVLHADS